MANVCENHSEVASYQDGKEAGGWCSWCSWCGWCGSTKQEEICGSVSHEPAIGNVAPSDYETNVPNNGSDKDDIVGDDDDDGNDDDDDDGNDSGSDINSQTMAEKAYHQRLIAARCRMSIRFRRDTRHQNNDDASQLRQPPLRNPTAELWRRPPQPSAENDNSNEPNCKVSWSKHLSVLLAGTRDPRSPLHLLRGYENIIIREIYTMVYQGWIDAVIITPPAHLIGRLPAFSGSIGEDQDYAPGRRLGTTSMAQTVLWSDGRLHRDYRSLGRSRNDHPKIAFSVCRTGIQFPEPHDINVNMMPFIMGDISSLPLYLHQYHDMIMKCPVEDTMMGQVCYVTVMEKLVEKDSTQRRNGLHVEALYAFSTESSCKVSIEYQHHWGIGHAYGPDELNGGLYMVSNIDHTTAVWDALVTDISEVNRHGGIEHLRPYLGAPFLLEAGDMIWLTDRTPHEALPQPVSGYRQYFRLVTSNISVWFEDHSTPNPLVPLPANVKLIKGSKFL